MSGKLFHQKLLASLHGSTLEGIKQDWSEAIKFPHASHHFPPATEQLVKLPVSTRVLLKAVWEDNRPSSFFKSPNLANWAPIFTAGYKTRFQVFDVDTSILSKVLLACRHHHTSLTALLHGLALVSLASFQDESRAIAYTSGTAIDQRRFLPSDHPDYPWFKPKETIGNYVTVINHVFQDVLVAQVRAKVATNDTKGSLSSDLLNLIWSTTIRVRGEIKNRLEMGLTDDAVGLMKFVPHWKFQFKKDVKKPRKLSWFVTNLGVLDGQHEQHEQHEQHGNESQSTQTDLPEETWYIRRAQFTLSTETPMAALLIAAMTVKSSRLVVTCTWQDGVVEAELVEHLMTDMKRWLAQMGAQS
jgi:hypothetical protein